jgi:hypothetical protein
MVLIKSNQSIAEKKKLRQNRGFTRASILHKQGLEYLGFLDSGEAEVETLKLECEFFVIHAQ